MIQVIPFHAFLAGTCLHSVVLLSVLQGAPLSATLHTPFLAQAISVAELYGVLDPDTRDWTDGLLSNIFREINKPLAGDKDEGRWVMRN